MYRIRDDVNLASMKRIGVITVDEIHLYRDVQMYLSRKDITPTEFFWDKIKANTYHAGENPILSYIDEDNMIIVKSDNNAMFLYSENPVLSPSQFVNLFANLYDCTKSASYELQRKIYANLDLENLNINFVDMILANGATPQFMEEYDNNFKRVNNSESIYRSELNGVKTMYNSQEEDTIYTYSSQYGMNLIKFLDTMINLNPDIRLLMSNTSISPYKSILVETFLNAVRNNYSGYRNYTAMEIAQDIDAFMSSARLIGDEEKKRFSEAFREEKRKSDNQIISSNESYKVFPVLKYVLGLKEPNTEKLKELYLKYILKWFDGDPDNGKKAIQNTLDVISETKRREDAPPIKVCRNLEEVKGYMSEIDNKVLEINRKYKRKEDKNRENDVY